MATYQPLESLIASFGNSTYEFKFMFHPHVPHSIAILQHQGMDFHMNRIFGVNIMQFAELVMLML